MTRLLAPCLLAIALAHPPSGVAATFPVDDSRSQVLTRLVRMNWDTPFPTGGANTISGRLSVIARLDVSPWRGRHGRIYMTLPPQSVDSVGASWTTRGLLLPGTVRVGERTLVYAGPIMTDLIEDTLQLTITADGDRVVRTETLDFRFEIDLDTP